MRKTKINTKKPNPIYSLAISYNVLITIHNCITGTHILHKTVNKVKKYIHLLFANFII